LDLLNYHHQKRNNVKPTSSAFTVLAAASCFTACLGDFVVTFIIGYFYRGYDFINQSESYLGVSASPVAIYMKIWSVVFSLLFVVYAYALKRNIFAKGVWQTWVVWLIAIYGLGEGIGSGLFPYDHDGHELTLSGKLHSVFSAIGDAALVVVPFILLKIFPKTIYPKLNRYIRLVAFSGPVIIIMFLLARQNLLPVKGLWQRIYLLDYYLLLVSLSVYMVIVHFRS
jgi:uncharacterized protein DUF998